MEFVQLYREISSLPASMRQEVKDFIDQLKTKKRKSTNIKERKFGCVKGMFKVNEYFDDPIDNFCY